LKITIIALGVLTVLALLLVRFTGGEEAASSPAAGEVTAMSVLENGIPPLDAARPPVTETAAFALG
jgi:hypothetical protein